MKRALAGAVLAFGALASPAWAENQVVTGLDVGLKWDKEAVSIQPGETVTWTFPGTQQAHHVAGNGSEPADPAWASFNSPLGVPAPDASFTFATPGVYRYVCTVHSSSMVGTVYVGTAVTPPALLPPNQQPFENQDASPVTLEKVDEDKAKPRLTSVSVRRASGHAVRVRFRVDEESTVQVRLTRGGRTIKTATVEGTGTRSVTVRGARPGRYRVELRATDIAGNRSPLKRTTITVR
ncbi:hypothetical protein DVA67_005485 [Solirubrobacter sp. CPCC 204708]|uniref:Ig-like domain-containing protein n=1 Tax=Solirubrobacter deserti TaxID=2282478 RepID=A0ABT4RGS0_9ACTN|nr:plastocyanin/azurin family copper-binding protein [Solirubrobacter deserti]MBE2315416.1 hypothetical protein [Solirubrobacter deserti]MDA0137742.1 Ig-like domain-containing protein [Solirubrobacter deserti]